jgi:hypothetical protein
MLFGLKRFLGHHNDAEVEHHGILESQFGVSLLEVKNAWATFYPQNRLNRGDFLQVH